MDKSAAKLESLQQEPPKPSTVSRVKRLITSIIDFLECDRMIGDHEQPDNEPLFEDDFGRRKGEQEFERIEYRKETRHMFRQSAKYNWYSLQSLKGLLCCLEAEEPEVVEEKKEHQRMVNLTQEDLLSKSGEFSVVGNEEDKFKVKRDPQGKPKKIKNFFKNPTPLQVTHKRQLQPIQIQIRNTQSNNNSSLSNHTTSNIVLGQSQILDQNLKQPIFFNTVAEDANEFTYQDSPDRRKNRALEIPPMVTPEEEVQEVCEVPVLERQKTGDALLERRIEKGRREGMMTFLEDLQPVMEQNIEQPPPVQGPAPLEHFHLIQKPTQIQYSNQPQQYNNQIQNPSDQPQPQQPSFSQAPPQPQSQPFEPITTALTIAQSSSPFTEGLQQLEQLQDIPQPQPQNIIFTIKPTKTKYRKKQQKTENNVSNLLFVEEKPQEPEVLKLESAPKRKGKGRRAKFGEEEDD